ncbi:MAG: argininosuccinate lyase [Gammaproteobacteria bacterium]|nr:argininosuccinate lyase [Gammaproteobacteria bacterium]
MTDSTKPWAGRFTEATDAFVEAFTASVGFDRTLAMHDIDGSVAHATMLAETGVIAHEECAAIVAGLETIRQRIERDEFEWSVSLEDVHMNIEHALTQEIGDVGKKLHTGRSRNDQIATDVRLYLREQIDDILAQQGRLTGGLLDLAEQEAATIMPGFTHLQVAQPVTFGHHLMAWYAMLERDMARLRDCRARVNVLPLGAAALAGTSYPIDRARTAELLGFDDVAGNSLDAVSDRDFAIEFASAASIGMMHYSRWSEELVLWTSSQFDFIDLPDDLYRLVDYAAEENPDVPELVRGKTGRTFGHLMSMLTLMKGQPLAYNKDNQEDKEPSFDLVRTYHDCTMAFADMVPAMTPKRENMRAATVKGFPTATDLADYLVRKGLAFRDAHEVVGRLVAVAIKAGCDLPDLPMDTMKGASELITDDVLDVLTVDGSVAARDHIGGTAPIRFVPPCARPAKRHCDDASCC